MTTKTNGAGWLTHITGVLAIIGVIASTTWTISKFPDRDETRAMIQRESPYVEDRARVMRVVERYDSVYDTLQGLRTDVALLTQQISSLESKLDDALEARGR